MLNFELLTSPAVQEFIQNAFKRKMDALQVSTALNKAGYKSKENPVHSPTFVAVVNEKAINTKIGKYIKRSNNQI